MHGGTAFGKRDGAPHGACALTVDRHTCQRDDNRRPGDKASDSLMKLQRIISVSPTRMPIPTGETTDVRKAWRRR